MKRILLALFFIFATCYPGFAAKISLHESVQELDGSVGTSTGADWRLTDFANFANINTMMNEIYGWSWYTQSQIDIKFLSYLGKTNTEPYTPTSNYHPATKKYVDDTAASKQDVLTNPILAAGAQDITGVKNFTVSPLVPAPTTDYQAANRKFVLDNAASVTGATIDDTAGSGDTDVVLSAGKVIDTFQPIDAMEYVDVGTNIVKTGTGTEADPFILDVRTTPTGTWNWATATVTWPIFNQSTTGNAATATALATNPTDCGVGYYARGIAADGSAENCTAVPEGGSGLTDGGSVLIDCGDSLSANGTSVIDGGAAI